MRLLVSFLLAALGCSLAEGLNVTKCGLRDELAKAIGDQPKEGVTVETLVPELVCHAEFASGFSTRKVSYLKVTPFQSRKKRETGGGVFGLAKFKGHLKTILPSPPTYFLQPRYARQASEQTEVWTLYGLFQLSNHLVCSDGTNKTDNLCDLDCSKLLDDDIHDDIDCILKLISVFVENGFNASEKLRRMIREIYQPECRDRDGAEYFAGCQPI